MPEADRLDEGHDPAAEEVCADEQSHLILGQLECAADDERDCDRAGIHEQDVLQTEQCQPRYR